MADEWLRIRGRFVKKTKSKRSQLATYRNIHKKKDFDEHNYFTPENTVIFPESPIVPVENVAENVTIALEPDKIHWAEGRRIVELSVLAEQLFCKTCNTPLHLKDVIGEIRLTFNLQIHLHYLQIVQQRACHGQIDTM